ncbi:MAG: septation regulator SpoVG [Clostridia bacterium]|nr:septation regulator SpoVG [Clostridia bacterium]
MNVSDIRIRIVKKDENKLKAVASLTIDECFAVHDIKIIEGNQGLFIAMPSRKTPDGTYKDVVHPLNTETREKIRDLILAEYEKALKEAPTEVAE